MKRNFNFQYINSNYIIYLIIVFFCIYFSLANSEISNNIDAGLIISNKIIIPDDNSPQLKIFSESLTLISYLIAVLIKIGLSNYFISNIFSFISTLFFVTGIYLISKNLIELIIKKYSNLISVIFTSLILLSDTHLPHTDYPNAYFGTFTTGIYAIALTTLIFGLMIEGKNKLVIFFTFLLILCHPIQGLWISGLLLLVYLIENIYISKSFNLKNLKYIILFISITLVFGIIFLFIYSGVNSPEIDRVLLDVWIKSWENHRFKTSVNYNYIIATILLSIISAFLFFIYLKKRREKTYRFFLLVLVSTTISTIIYFVYKLIFDYLPLFIIIPMPTRLINSHAMITHPIIIISILILVSLISEKFNLNKKISFLSIFIILLGGYMFNHKHENLNQRFKSIYKNRFEKVHHAFINNINKRDIDYYDQNFWRKVRELDNSSYTIVTRSTENLSYRYGFRAYLLKTTADYVMYRPKTINQTVKILTGIYEIDFVNGKTQFTEDYIKEKFENKSKNNWILIKNNFNARYVIVPINWRIDLNLILKNEKFGVYEIQ